MNEYLDTFNKITPNEFRKEEYIKKLEEIKMYILGIIDPKELIREKDDDFINVIYNVINRIMNYKEGSIKHYIKLPGDSDFNNGGSYHILAAKTNGLQIFCNNFEMIGPKLNVRNVPHTDSGYAEITGNLESYKEGLIISKRDWFILLKKYPFLYERMQSLYKYDDSPTYRKLTYDQVINIVDEYIERQLAKEENSTLDKDTSDSITFVKRKIYLPYDDIKKGKIEPFANLVKRAN